MSLKFALIASFAASTIASGFGQAAWDTDPDDSVTPEIIKVQTTLQIPEIADQGLLLWPGLAVENGGLVQTLISNDPIYLGDYCGTTDNVGWCVVSYFYSGAMNVDGDDGLGYLANPGDLIDITYELSDGNWTQTASLNGNMITYLNWGQSTGVKLADTIECYRNTSGTPAHTYTNTVITLNEANPNFNTTLSASDGSTPASFGDTSDYITWTIDSITVAASTCIAQ